MVMCECQTPDMVTMMGGHDFAAEDDGLERINQVVRIRPGDRVLLALRDGYNHSTAAIQYMQDRLKEQWPDVDFVIVAGADVAGIIRPDAE